MKKFKVVADWVLKKGFEYPHGEKGRRLVEQGFFSFIAKLYRTPKALWNFEKSSNNGKNSANNEEEPC